MSLLRGPSPDLAASAKLVCAAYKSRLALLRLFQVATLLTVFSPASAMKFISASTVALSILLAGSARAATYNVAETFQGPDFLSGFSFYSAPDPTHGRV